MRLGNTRTEYNNQEMRQGNTRTEYNHAYHISKCTDYQRSRSLTKVIMALISTLYCILVLNIVFTGAETTTICLKENIDSQCDPNLKIGIVYFKENNNSICFHGDTVTWKEKEATLVCRQLKFAGGWPYAIKIINSNKVSSQHNYSAYSYFKCAGGEKDVTKCLLDYIGTCDEPFLAGVECFGSFNVQLVGGSTPNAGRVQVQYDDEWSDVCFDARGTTRDWGFHNVQVVCSEKGYPGAMHARRFSKDQKETTLSSVDGFKCKNGLKPSEKSLMDCSILNSSRKASPCVNTNSLDNYAAAICALPGYVGCFNFTQIITNTSSQLKAGSITINRCRHYCRDSNWHYTYLHKGDTCYCSNQTLRSDAVVGDSKCQQPCNGSNDEVCGDFETVSVYDVVDGMCQDPMNASKVYYFGETYNDIKHTCNVNITTLMPVQCGGVGHQSINMSACSGEDGHNYNTEAGTERMTTKRDMDITKHDNTDTGHTLRIVGFVLGVVILAAIIFPASIIIAYVRKKRKKKDAARTHGVEPHEEKTFM